MTLLVSSGYGEICVGEGDWCDDTQLAAAPFYPAISWRLPRINSTPRIDSWESNRQLQLPPWIIFCKVLHSAGNMSTYLSAGGEEAPGAGGITPLCQQSWLCLAPTCIHLLKLNLSLTQLGVVVATQLGKLTATGGSDKQPRWGP